jgi:hypothetical protein
MAASFAALVVPTAAMAGAPDGSFNFKDNGGARSENASVIGELSSRITQNGQFVAGNGASAYDQTTSPGSRADIVQNLLGH